MRKRAAWLDLIVAVGIVSLCVGLFFCIFERNRSQASYGVLYCDDEEIARFDLSVPGTFYPDEERFPGLSIEVKDGAVRFLENSCPDLVCVHTGFLSAEGTYAVCLPYHLRLCVEGTDLATSGQEVDN